jgi:hypothetical protein
MSKNTVTVYRVLRKLRVDRIITTCCCSYVLSANCVLSHFDVMVSTDNETAHIPIYPFSPKLLQVSVDYKGHFTVPYNKGRIL